MSSTRDDKTDDQYIDPVVSVSDLAQREMDRLDPDKPARAVVQARQQAADDAVAALAEPKKLWHGDELPLYVWVVPGPNGYAMRIEVADSPTLVDAKAIALAYMPCTEGEEGTDSAKYRNLSSLEHNWITTHEPEIVRDTSLISITYSEALAKTEQLARENGGFRKTRELFKAHDIDIYNPEKFINRNIERREREIKAYKDEKDAALVRADHALLEAEKSVSDARDALGKRPAAPIPKAPPDYSKLVVLVPDDVNVAEKWPDLAAAHVTRTSPQLPPSPGLRLALDKLLGRYGLLEEKWRAGGESMTAAASWRELQAHLTAIYGVGDEVAA